MTFNPPIYGADVNGSLYDPVGGHIFLFQKCAIKIVNVYNILCMFFFLLAGHQRMEHLPPRHHFGYC